MKDPGYWRDLETPAGLVDVDRMEANLRRTSEYCRRWKISYRPHAKTHKSAELARLQVKAGAVGMTVATAKEAEVMAKATDEILMAYPPVGGARLTRLLSLPESISLSVAIDSSHALQGLAKEARTRGRSVGARIKIDMGLGRVGVQTVEEALKLTEETLDTEGVHYQGILMYPGHIRTPVVEQEPEIKALSAKLGTFLEGLSNAGCTPEIVSGGSTPTLFRSHQIAGVNEVRPGTGVFNDRTTALLGASGWDDCAYSVLATVVSTSVPGQAVVDAGSKALAKEEVRGTFQDPSIAVGFGCVLDEPELRVTALSEEHGVIDLGDSAWHPKPGDLVRIVPNHVCVSVNLNEGLWLVQGERVLGYWPVEARSG